MRILNKKMIVSFGLLLFIKPMAHADLTFSPVQLYISGERDQRSTTATLNTKGEKSDRTYEVSVFRWSQDDAGNEVLTPDHELVVNPKALVLKPDGNRVIRFGFRKSIESMNLTQEATWRVKFTEIPSALQKTGMSIALNFSVPVFVGSGFQPDVAFYIKNDANKNNVLHIKNSGTAHFQLTKFNIQDEAGKVLKEVETMKYVLPKREVTIPLDGLDISSKKLKLVIQDAAKKDSPIYDIMGL
jgi:fimbrial chaperone protein